MELTLTFFGKLIEVAGNESIQFYSKATTMQELRKELIQTFPKLGTLTFQLAQNNKICLGKATIKSDQIDIFPPFSGG